MVLDKEHLGLRTELLGKIIEIERVRPELFDIVPKLQGEGGVSILPHLLPLAGFKAHVESARTAAKLVEDHLDRAKREGKPEAWLRELGQLHARARTNLIFAVEAHKARRTLEQARKWK